MIKVNNKQYDNYDVKITWGNFESVLDKEKVKGIAPFITFNIDNNTFIGIETSLSKEKLKSINTKLNINKYITDVTYEDEKGWLSIINGKYDCSITRVDEDVFKIDLNVLSEELDEINIVIEENLELL